MEESKKIYIISEAKSYLENPSKINKLGVFEGSSSRLMLSSIIGGIDDDPFFLNYSQTILTTIFSNLEKKEIKDFSFGYGLSGFAWTIDYLIKEGCLAPEQVDQSTLDNIVRASFNHHQINLDFLTGDLSLITYFLDRPTFQPEIEKIVNYLITIAKNKSYPIFTSPYRNKKNKFENAQYYGIAHGFGGLIIILSKIKKKGIKEKECVHLIDTIFKHLMSVKEKGIFPLFSTKKVTNWEERFSWCHGNFRKPSISKSWY